MARPDKTYLKQTERILNSQKKKRKTKRKKNVKKKKVKSKK